MDILANNAGVIGPIGPLEGNDPDQWLETARVNLFGEFLCCKYTIPYMKRRKWGRVIRLSGAGAPLPYPMFSAYSAAKIGVIGLAQTLAEEVQESGIQVNAVAPWLTNTKMQDEIISAGDLAGPSLQRVIDSKKGKRINPMSVADLITFLSSKAADGITGRFLSARWGDWQSLTDPSKMKGSLKVKRMR